ncbi:MULTISPECIES: HdeD family acid-resistance protein [unclassified Frankia]
MATIYRQHRRQQAPSALWPALLLLGAAVTVLGLLLITNPFATAGTLAVLAGVALVLSGISETIAAVRSENTAGTALFGIMLAVGGVIVLLWPGATLRVVALLVGAILIITGVVRALVTWASRSSHGTGRGIAGPLILAALSIVLGVLALTWPGATIMALAVIFGIQLIVTGVTEIALGLALRPRGHS